MLRHAPPLVVFQLPPLIHFPCCAQTGVDDSTYSSTGEAYSTVILPNTELTREKRLQADDVSLGKPHNPLLSQTCVQLRAHPTLRPLQPMNSARSSRDTLRIIWQKKG